MMVEAIFLLVLPQISVALPLVGRNWGEDIVISQEQRPWDGNTYSFRYQTLFGTSRKEEAVLKMDNDGNEYMHVEGEYRYPMQNGYLRKITYTANKDGYRELETALVKTDEILFTESSGSGDVDTLNQFGQVIDNNLKSLLTTPGTTNTIDGDMKTIENDKNNFKPKMNFNKFEPDRIAFPKDEENKWSTEKTVLTTVNIPETMPSGNLTSMDYYYDDLGNRIGGIPPAVLGSLLG